MKPRQNDVTIWLTLATCAAAGLASILALYAIASNRNPLNRLGYGVFVSAAPAIAALVASKVLHLRLSKIDAVLLYLGLFILVVILQAVARLIPM